MLKIVLRDGQVHFATKWALKSRSLSPDYTYAACKSLIRFSAASLADASSPLTCERCLEIGEGLNRE